MEQIIINDVQYFLCNNDFLTLSTMCKFSNYQIIKKRRDQIRKKISINALVKVLKKYTDIEDILEYIEDEKNENNEIPNNMKIEILKILSDDVFLRNKCHLYNSIKCVHKKTPLMTIKKYINICLPKIGRNSRTMFYDYDYDYNYNYEHENNILNNYKVSAVYRLSRCSIRFLKRDFRYAMALIY